MNTDEQHDLKSFCRQLNLLLFGRRLLLSLVVATTVFVILLAARHWVVPLPRLPIALGLGAFVFLGAAFYTLQRPVSMYDAAVIADQRLGTRNQFATLFHMKESDPWTSAIRRTLSDKKISHCPQHFIFPRPAWSLCLALPLAVWMWTFPVFTASTKPGLSSFKTQAREAAKHLEEEADTLEETEPASEEANKMVEEMRQIAKELKAGKLSRQEAFEKIMKLSQKIQDRKQMRRALDQMKTALAADEDLASLAKALGEGDSAKQSELLAKLGKALAAEAALGGDELAGKVEDVLDKLSRDASDAEGAKISEAVQKITDAMKMQQDDVLQEGLSDLAEAISKADARTLDEKTLQRMMGACQAAGGNCQGQGQAQGKGGSRAKFSLTNRGKRGSDWGVGSTNLEDENGREAEEREHTAARQSLDQNTREEEFVSLYAPERKHVNAEDERIRGQINEGKVIGMMELKEAPDQGEASYVPYQKVIRSYREEAEDALKKQSIPAEHRKSVKHYFDSLEGSSP